MPVHAGELEFVFEVGDRAQSADDDGSADLLHEFDQQVTEADDFYVFQVAQLAATQRDALLEAEQRLLVRALGDRDHHLVEDPRRARNQIGVTIGHGVECAGIDRDPGGAHALVPFTDRSRTFYP